MFMVKKVDHAPFSWSDFLTTLKKKTRTDIKEELKLQKRHREKNNNQAHAPPSFTWDGVNYGI